MHSADETTSWDAPVPLLDNGDPASAEDFNGAPQALVHRTAFLKYNQDALLTAVEAQAAQIAQMGPLQIRHAGLLADVFSFAGNNGTSYIDPASFVVGHSFTGLQANDVIIVIASFNVGMIAGYGGLRGQWYDGATVTGATTKHTDPTVTGNQILMLSKTLAGSSVNLEIRGIGDATNFLTVSQPYNDAATWGTYIVLRPLV